jgi:2-polyprenyl-3-methyl-5-hydroxy-6-metoxy-1,4-benzoquinol methylase
MLTTLKTKYRNWMASDHKLRKMRVSLHYYVFRHKLWKELVSLDAKNKFTAIYRNNLWNNEESYSGGGSTLRRTTQLRSQLPSLLKERNIKSICDVGCGDFNWMKHLDIGDVTYIGVDIVTDIIDINRTLYGTSRRVFFELNVVQQVVPEVDLILCRECLIHLSLADIHATISNFKASRSTYLLATHSPNIERNVDVVTGECRALNLTLRPFHFPEPIAILSEDQSHHCLALWRLADINPQLPGSEWEAGANG